MELIFKKIAALTFWVTAILFVAGHCPGPVVLVAFIWALIW